MLVMFAAGVASLVWMGPLTAVMVHEKTRPGGARTVPVDRHRAARRCLDRFPVLRSHRRGAPMTVTAGNREAVEAWDGVLFDRFASFRHIILPGLGAHGDRGLELHPPRTGERVLDIGCGFGDTTRQIAAMVQPGGEAVGVDASHRFIEAARSEADEAAVTKIRFAVADVEAGGLGSGYDRAFSRFGTMFFANPVRALRNVRAALVPGGELCMIVWRQKADNPWLHAAELAVERILDRREDSDQPTCGPGPFSMANADTTSGILVSAGYDDIRLDPLRHPDADRPGSRRGDRLRDGHRPGR